MGYYCHPYSDHTRGHRNGSEALYLEGLRHGLGIKNSFLDSPFDSPWGGSPFMRQDMGNMLLGLILLSLMNENRQPPSLLPPLDHRNTPQITREHQLESILRTLGLLTDEEESQASLSMGVIEDVQVLPDGFFGGDRLSLTRTSSNDTFANNSDFADGIVISANGGSDVIGNKGNTNGEIFLTNRRGGFFRPDDTPGILFNEGNSKEGITLEGSGIIANIKGETEGKTTIKGHSENDLILTGLKAEEGTEVSGGDGEDLLVAVTRNMQGDLTIDDDVEHVKLVLGEGQFLQENNKEHIYNILTRNDSGKFLTTNTIIYEGNIENLKVICETEAAKMDEIQAIFDNATADIMAQRQKTS